MKSSSSLPRCLGLLLLAAGFCATFTGCVEERRRTVHHGYYDRDYDRHHDRYVDRRDDRYYEPGYRRSSSVSYDAPGASVTVRRSAPVSSGAYYERY